MAEETSTLVLTLRDEISPQLKNINAALDQVNRSVRTTGEGMSAGMRRLRDETERVGESVRRSNQHLSSMAVFFRSLGTSAVTAASAYGIGGVIRALDNFSTSALNTSYAAKHIQLSTETLMGFEQAGRRLGMSSEATRNQLTGLYDKIIDLSRGPASEFGQELDKMGVKGTELRIRMKALREQGRIDEAVKLWTDTMKMQAPEAARWMERIGGVSRTFGDLSDAMGKNRREFTLTDAQSRLVKGALVDLDVTVQNITGHLGLGFAQAIGKVNEEARSKGLDDFEQTMQKLGKWAGGFLASELQAIANGIKNTQKEIEDLENWFNRRGGKPPFELVPGGVADKFINQGSSGAAPYNMDWLLPNNWTLPDWMRGSSIKDRAKPIEDLWNNPSPVSPFGNLNGIYMGAGSDRGSGTTASERQALRELSDLTTGFGQDSYRGLGGIYMGAGSDPGRRGWRGLPQSNNVEDRRGTNFSDRWWPGGGSGQGITAGQPSFLFDAMKDSSDDQVKATEDNTREIRDLNDLIRQQMGLAPRGGGGGVGGGSPASNPMGNLGGGKSSSVVTGGGTRGDRNNNPGNLKYGDFAKSMGATGADSGGFAIFPDQQTGRSAMERLLSTKGAGQSIEQVGSWYAPKQPNWVTNTAKAMGVDPSYVPKPEETGRFADAIQRAEGTGKTASGSDVIPSEVLDKARSVAAGGPMAVQRFLAGYGYHMTGPDCGRFAASVVKSLGGTPPANPEIASNWNNYGDPTSNPQGGDLAVAKPGWAPHRGSGRTGKTGSHVTTFGGFTDKSGEFFWGTGAGQGGLTANTKRFRTSNFNFRTHPQEFRDRIDRANSAASGLGTGGKLGSARIDVNVKAPRGTEVQTNSDGIFDELRLNRTPQMPRTGMDDRELGYE